MSLNYDIGYNNILYKKSEAIHGVVKGDLVIVVDGTFTGYMYKKGDILYVDSVCNRGIYSNQVISEHNRHGYLTNDEFVKLIPVGQYEVEKHDTKTDRELIIELEEKISEQRRYIIRLNKQLLEKDLDDVPDMYHNLKWRRE